MVAPEAGTPLNAGTENENDTSSGDVHTIPQSSGMLAECMTTGRGSLGFQSDMAIDGAVRRRFSRSGEKDGDLEVERFGVEGAGMIECSCGGRNPSCAMCGGSGLIEDEPVWCSPPSPAGDDGRGLSAIDAERRPRPVKPGPRRDTSRMRELAEEWARQHARKARALKRRQEKKRNRTP